MNDEPPQNVVQAATKVANALITALPPAFVSLVALNVIFLALTFWFLTTQSREDKGDKVWWTFLIGPSLTRMLRKLALKRCRSLTCKRASPPLRRAPSCRPIVRHRQTAPARQRRARC